MYIIIVCILTSLKEHRALSETLVFQIPPQLLQLAQMTQADHSTNTAIIVQLRVMDIN